MLCRFEVLVIWFDQLHRATCDSLLPFASRLPRFGRVRFDFWSQPRRGRPDLKFTRIISSHTKQISMHITSGFLVRVYKNLLHGSGAFLVGSDTKQLIGLLLLLIFVGKFEKQGMIWPKKECKSLSYRPISQPMKKRKGTCLAVHQPSLENRKGKTKPLVNK